MTTPDNAAPENGEGLGFTAPESVERRVWRNIIILVALGAVAAAVAADRRFLFGLVLGGALALLNYRWLNSSLKAVLAVGSAKTPPGTMIKFIVRWLVIAAVAWVANSTGFFDPVAILAGLFAPAVAIVIEAVYVTIRATADRKENHN